MVAKKYTRIANGTVNLQNSISLAPLISHFSVASAAYPPDISVDVVVDQIEIATLAGPDAICVAHQKAAQHQERFHGQIGVEHDHVHG
jgi:hypothetical protein